MKYEIRQIDAWSSGESWTWNESYKIGEFKTSAADHKRAFLNALRKIWHDLFNLWCTLFGNLYGIRSQEIILLCWKILCKVIRL